MATLSSQNIRYQQEHKDENRASDMIIANVVMLSAAYIAVVLRFISRRLSHAELKADDWMIMLGLVGLQAAIDSNVLCFAVC